MKNYLNFSFKTQLCVIIMKMRLTCILILAKNMTVLILIKSKKKYGGLTGSILNKNFTIRKMHGTIKIKQMWPAQCFGNLNNSTKKLVKKWGRNTDKEIRLFYIQNFFMNLCLNNQNQILTIRNNLLTRLLINNLNLLSNKNLN